MKISGLHGRKVVDRVRRHGNRWKGRHMSMTYVANRNEELLVGTSASKKLHKSAVKRNKMRRRCREALRVTVKEQQVNELTSKQVNVSLLITPRSSSLTCDFIELRDDAEAFLNHL
jgi:ribonuclease P protein component